MPRRSGYEVLRSLRKDERIRETRVVVVSSKNQQSDRVWGMRQGADEYLPKPFTPEQLVTIVGRSSNDDEPSRQLRGGSGVCLHPGRRAVRDRRHPGARSGRLPGVDDGAAGLSPSRGRGELARRRRPIADARGVLKLAARRSGRKLWTLIVEAEGCEVALVIDGEVSLEAFGGITSLDESSPQPHAEWALGFLPDGERLVPLLDPARLLRALREGRDKEG